MNRPAAETLLPLLRCPRCGAEMARGEDGYRCAGPDGHRYPSVDGQPVLVDFESSILQEADFAARAGASAIAGRGGSGALGRVAGALLPHNAVAAPNAVRLKSLARGLSERPRILVVGGGGKGAGTDPLYDDTGVEIVAFDIYASPLTHFVADAHRIPLADASVDAVWIQAVLEHVLDPWQVVAEIHRVLRDGGVVYAETPFLQQVHEGPYDFTRFTESGHRWLFRRFEAIDSGVVMGTASQLLWSVEHLFRGLFRSVRAGRIAALLLFWLRWFDSLIPAPYAVDAASAVFFLGRKTDEAIRPAEIVGYYQGAHSRRA